MNGPSGRREPGDVGQRVGVALGAGRQARHDGAAGPDPDDRDPPGVLQAGGELAAQLLGRLPVDVRGHTVQLLVDVVDQPRLQRADGDDHRQAAEHGDQRNDHGREPPADHGSLRST